MENINKRIIPFLYYLLLFFVPLILTPYNSELFEFNKMLLTYAITISVVCFWTISMVFQRKFLFRRTILDIPLLIFLITQLISTILSFDFRTSLLGYYSRYHGGLLSSISYALLYWGFVSNMDMHKTKKAIFVLISSSFIVSVYGIMEHFGIDKNIWVQDVQLRVFSTLGQPNWLAAWIASLIPVTWGFFIASKKKLNNLRRIFWLVSGMILTLTLLYTKSRSGILAFSISYLLFWGILFLRNFRNYKKYLSGFAIVSAIIIAIFLIEGTPWTPKLIEIVNNNRFSQNEGVSENYTAPVLELGGTKSTKIREIVWKGAVDIWKHYPVFGTGVETFAFSYYNFRPAEHNITSEWDFLYNKAHNEYLNFLATTGSVGTIAYLILIFAILWVFVKNGSLLKIKKDPASQSSNMNIALISGFVSILISNFFGFSVVSVALSFFLFPAFSYSLRAKEIPVKDDKKYSGTQYILAVLIGIISLYALVLTSRYWRADYHYNLGKNMDDAGQYIKSQEEFEKAISLSGQESIFWIDLAESSANIAVGLYQNDSTNEIYKKYLNKAQQESEKAKGLSPKNVNIIRKQANIYIILSSIDPTFMLHAQKALTDAVSLAPTEAKLIYNLGLTYAKTGNIEKALELLKTSVEMKPNYKDARMALAFLLKENGHGEEAKEHLLYILEFLSPDDKLAKELLEDI